MAKPARFDAEYELGFRYSLDRGRIYCNGVQALVRLPLVQRRRDTAAGLRTAGFISGYRGSPLGTLDLALWQAQEQLAAHDVHFEPGVNEDLAATAVWGSQQAPLMAGARVEGVFAMWYGKGPGVDRSCDALKHGNLAGSSPHGGVLVLAGDDPGAKSSSLAHQSEHALVHCGIPVLNPADVQDYLDLGLYGWAMSRFAGCWVGFKCVTDTVESSASVEVEPDRVHVRLPDDFTAPPGLHIAWANPPLEVERRLLRDRLPAAQAFVRANGLDRVVLDAPTRRLGIVTTGKASLDVRQALEDLGIDQARAAQLGLSLYKVAMSWPLEPEGITRFATGLEEVIVVEEKRPLIEDQIASLLYNDSSRPRLVGKRDLSGAPLLASDGELSPAIVADALTTWLGRVAPHMTVATRPEALTVSSGTGLARRPAFCSGCPHNTSTQVPDGSVAQGGIGCHGMAVWIPERHTLAYTHMGGEGANWIGTAPFTDTPHIFQNMGDGTYFHSGVMAVRAAVAAGVNITFKVLANGAIAMTGGQPIEGESIDGAVLVPDLVRQLAAEGVGEIVVVGDDPRRYGSALPPGVAVRHRNDLDRVQRQLREVPGVTAIVYDQTCAAEARRLRKRGEFPDPDQRIIINELVCEGCGDCSVQSNCISIEPVETEFGRKRTINQHTCNKDYSCLRGYCPSFAIVKGGRLRSPAPSLAGRPVGELLADLPPPLPVDTTKPVNVLVTGIGGTGVITIGALLGMAAHLEGKGCSVLDVTGLAQKNGPVTSHVRVADDAAALHAPRIGRGTADLVLGCDIVVTTGPESLATMAQGRTTAIVNRDVVPTSDFASNPDLDLAPGGMERLVRAAAGDDRVEFLAATELATAVCGDSIATNLFLVGYALQRGLLPVDIDALERAIELNRVKVDMNKQALAWGRVAAHDRAAVERAAGHRALDAADTSPKTVAQLVERRVGFLTAYQNARYARRYRGLVDRVAAREHDVVGESRLSEAVARYFFKLMAYKDEYEVARLYVDGSFRRQLAGQFEGDYTVQLHLAPQRFVPKDRTTGRARKLTFGRWFWPVLHVLARLKFLRGTWLDVFGRTPHRRVERRLIEEYEHTIDTILGELTADTYAVAVEIASIPEHIRGYGVVKDEHLAEAKAHEVELLHKLRAPEPAMSG